MTLWVVLLWTCTVSGRSAHMYMYRQAAGVTAMRAAAGLHVKHSTGHPQLLERTRPCQCHGSRPAACVRACRLGRAGDGWRDVNRWIGRLLEPDRAAGRRAVFGTRAERRDGSGHIQFKWSLFTIARRVGCTTHSTAASPFFKLASLARSTYENNQCVIYTFFLVSTPAVQKILIVFN